MLKALVSLPVIVTAMMGTCCGVTGVHFRIESAKEITMLRLSKCILILLSICSSSLYAAGNSGIGEVFFLYQRSSDGLLVVTKDNGDWENPDGCQNSHSLVLAGDNPFRSEFYSAILASKIAGRNFKAHLNGCFNWNGVSYPKIDGVYTY